MADSTISGLPLKASPIGADSLEIVDSVGVSSKKITIATLPISTATTTALSGKEPTITGSTNDKYWRGDKTFVTLDQTAVGLPNVDNTTDANKPVSIAQQSALDLKLDLASSKTYTPNAGSGYFAFLSNQINIDPIANSPAETYALMTQQITFDTLNAGFSTGVGGEAAQIFNLGFNHQGKSNIGHLTYFNLNNDIGNGSDAINVGGISFVNGFMNIDANVTLDGMQGFLFQTNMAAGSFMTNQTTAFNVGCNLQTAIQGFAAYNSGSNLLSIKTNTNFVGYSEYSTVPTFTGTAGYFGVTISPVLGTFGTGGFQGVYVNPTITNVKNATGVYSNMNNVTIYAGTVSSIVIQDLTFAFILPNDNNAYTIAFTAGGTAGSEVVTIAGQVITIQIDSGVSTATQVKAACDAAFSFASNISTTISGVGANAQVAVAAANLTGGTNPGQKYAGFFEGDVNITGSLTFGGALSIGKLSAFDAETVVNGGGNPQTIHGLITQVTAPNGVTTANYDYIGVNTSSLFTAEANSTNTAGPLAIGACSLGLPMVITTQTGSLTDVVCGAIFALSMDGTSTGGTITQAIGGRAVVIPNGITTIDRHYGWYSDCPFGTIATDNWGIYSKDSEKNFLEGALKIGIGGDVPTASMALDVGGDTYLAGAVTIGVAGNPLTQILTATVTLNFPSTGPNSGSDLTATVTGALVGDVVSVGVVSAALPSGTNDDQYFAWVSAADTVTVRYLNVGGGTHDPASSTFKIMVTQF